jgi:hypothetical protein
MPTAVVPLTGQTRRSLARSTPSSPKPTWPQRPAGSTASTSPGSPGASAPDRPLAALTPSGLEAGVSGLAACRAPASRGPGTSGWRSSARSWPSPPARLAWQRPDAQPWSGAR